MRLGAPVSGHDGPDEWVATLDERGYAAAYCPVDVDAGPETVRAYAAAAADADVAVAEVGAFGVNLISPDPGARREAFEAVTRALSLADAVGANCCVAVAGSRRPDAWAAPHPENFAPETVERIVERSRAVVDDVDPESATFALEAMPWVPPDSAESYRRVHDAVEREAFGVHLDPVNLLSSPRRFSNHVDVVERFVAEFGDDVEAVHLKGARLGDDLTVHVSETAPGAGDLDLAGVLRALDSLDDDTPLLLEHLPDSAAYDRATARVRDAADEAGVTL